MPAINEKIRLYSELVKFEHTVFALPFALSAMLLASEYRWPDLTTVSWVVLAMIGGRTFAMGLNRIIDRHIDGKNPRTQNRTLPSGKIRLGEAWGLTLFSLALMIFATSQLPVICIKLLPLAIGILVVYSFVKRFSNLSHLVLGLALGSSAIGGWLAVTGKISFPSLLFGTSVLFWVAGFDIIYACQDVDFDRKNGLWSIPSQLGIETGLVLSRIFHLITVLLLCWVGFLLPYTSVFYWIAVICTACMLIYEHSLVTKNDLSRVNEAFFNVNGIISITIFVLIALDKLFIAKGLLQ